MPPRSRSDQTLHKSNPPAPQGHSHVTTRRDHNIIGGSGFNEPLVLLGEDGAPFFDPYKPKAYLIDGPAWVNNHAHVLRPRPGLDRRFLRYYLDYADYRGYANGTTRLKLTQAAMRSMPVPVVPSDEQRRIVDILEDHLSRLDAADCYASSAENRSKVLVITSAATQLAAPGDDWVWSTVGSRALLVEYGSGSKASPQPSQGSIPVLRMGNIKRGAVDWTSLKYLPVDHGDFPKLMLRPGDLLFNRTNSAEHVGKSAVFDVNVPASFASYLIRVRFDTSVLSAWANLSINSPQGRAYVASVVSQQVGQANVNGTKLRAFPLPIPPLHEQARRVSEHRAVIEASNRLGAQITQSRARANGLRRAVLAAAFSGKLTGRHTDQEVIEELAQS